MNHSQQSVMTHECNHSIVTNHYLATINLFGNDRKVATTTTTNVNDGQNKGPLVSKSIKIPASKMSFSI